METIQPPMVNEHYSPAEGEEQVLDLLKESRDGGSPWGRVTPLYVREETGIEKGNVEYYLRQLTAAGWVRRLTSGLYEFVEDPRE